MLPCLYISFATRVIAQLQKNEWHEEETNSFQHKKASHSNTACNNISITLTMSDKIIPSLQTLPVEIVYRILDHMDNFTMICSMINVCTRVNRIMDTYHRYQVNFSFFYKVWFLFLSKYYESVLIHRNEQLKIAYWTINSFFIFIISYRQSHISTSTTIKLELKLHNILVKDYKTTQWERD